MPQARGAVIDDAASVAPAVAEDQPGTAPMLQPGRVLAGFAGPGHGPGAWLIRVAYRLGVPGQTLAAPFRKPQRVRLLATVANPLPGNKVAGTALRAGHFQVHGLKLLIGQIDFAGTAPLAPPVARMVHGFAWLADLEAAAPREQVTLVAERILAAWLAANEQPPEKPGENAAWSVANTGHRLVNWLVHAPLILSGSDKVLRARALAAITATALWLDRHARDGEDGLAQVAAWAAIVAAGLLLPDGRPRRLYGEAGLIAALGKVLGDDGGVLSRSPLDQIEAIALLVQLAACYHATRRAMPPSLQAVLALLVPPLLALTHGDGTLASWQGSWAVGAADLAGLTEASAVRARSLRNSRLWGYQRVAAGPSILLLDAAPPPLARHARYGCASTLAIEFSHAGHRIFVNCGGAGAAGGLMPQRLEQGLRATAAHSTLVLDNANSTAVLGQGRLGAGVSEVKVDRRALSHEEAGRAASGAVRLEASHDGYVSRYGLIHRRILVLNDDGAELRGEDVLVPTRARARRGEVAYALRFHLGPGIDASVSQDGRAAGLALADGSYWEFFANHGELTIEESIWADGQGCPVPIQQLVMQDVAQGGGAFTWLLRKLVAGQ